MCGEPTDGTRITDRTPVPDNCCRIYELENMTGTYLEICNDGDGQESPVAWLDSMRGSYDNDRAVFSWDNEITSWKCGKSADIKLCYDSDWYLADGTSINYNMSDTECPGGIDREETGHARSGNGRVGANDTISKLIISPPTRPWE